MEVVACTLPNQPLTNLIHEVVDREVRWAHRPLIRRAGYQRIRGSAVTDALVDLRRRSVGRLDQGEVGRTRICGAGEDRAEGLEARDLRHCGGVSVWWGQCVWGKG